MRLVAALISLVVATAAASLPASFVTIRYEARASMSDAPDHDGEGSPMGDAESSPSEDDDLDGRDDGDLDDLVAILDVDVDDRVPLVNETSWAAHVPRSPRSPHRQDTLRPPIAS